MIKLLKNIKPIEWLLVVISLAFVVVQVWLELTMPDYMSEMTTLIQTEGSAMSAILTAGLKMLLCALGSLVSSCIIAICSAKIASGFSATVREKLFVKVQNFSMEEIGHFSTASLITRSTNDLTQVQMFIVMGMQMLMKAPIMAIWAIAKIANKQWQWTLTTAVAVVVLLTVIIICLVIATPKFKKLQSLTDDLNRVARENLTGLNVVRAYNAEQYQEDKFKQANENLTRTQLFTQRVMAFLMPSITLVMCGLTLGVYWIGAGLINAAEMTEKIGVFSDMIVFSQYALQVVMAFMMLVVIFMLWPRTSVAANRINEVLNTKTKIYDGNETDGTSGNEGTVEFKNVSFSYPDAEEAVIENISFMAGRGETVALIGSTGCGKSTIINLIPRFYDVTSGEVLVDGLNVKDYKQNALRNKIGYVSQKATLFKGTITSNIAFGDNGKSKPSAQDIKDAVAIAQSTDFVENIENTYDGYVAQGGANFSGGQKQRISIARAIARKPEILIFDDSFSALDYKTDRILRNALAENCSDSTKIIVAQRIGTIRNADKILVIDDGKIAGMGTHDELMKNCDVYKQIALSQLSEAELA